MRDSIIHGDCLVELPKLASNSVDLIVTDPPYGMDYQSSRRTDKYDKIEGDFDLAFLKPFLKEAYRVLKDNSHIYLFCNDYAISDFRKEMELVGFTPKRTLVWVKNNHTSGDLEGDYGNKTEFIIFGHKGRRKLNGNRDTNVVKAKKSLNELHPTEKPVELMKYLIEKSSDVGDLVLDPFAGSGSTLLASKSLSRDYIGFEINQNYHKTAEERLKNVPQSLF